MGKVGCPSPGCQYDPSRVLVGSVLASPALIVVSILFHPGEYEVESFGQDTDCDSSRVNLIAEEGKMVRHTKGVGQHGTLGHPANAHYK